MDPTHVFVEKEGFFAGGPGRFRWESVTLHGGRQEHRSASGRRRPRSKARRFRLRRGSYSPAASKRTRSNRADKRKEGMMPAEWVDFKSVKAKVSMETVSFAL